MIKRTRFLLIIIGLLMLMTTSALATYFYAPLFFANLTKTEIANLPEIVMEVNPTPEPSVVPESEAASSSATPTAKERTATPSVSPKAKIEPQNTSGSLTEALVNYFKLSNQDNVNIINQSATHAQGQVGQKWWLAVKAKNGWKIVATGTSYINCNDIAGFNFPSSMAPACWDNATNQLINR